MAKRRGKARPRHSVGHPLPAAPPRASVAARLGEAVAVTALVAVVVGTALLVDPGAHASFDAPKRLVALAGISIAAFAAFALPLRLPGPFRAWRALPVSSRIAVVALAAGIVWAALSALLSPRRAASLDSFRALFLYALLLPLGASRTVGRHKGVLVAAFLGAAAVNAGVSLLQSRGIQPFRLQTFGARNETGALAGNVGYLALSVALAAVISLGIVLASTRPLPRVLAGAAFLLFLAALLVNRNLTAVLSLAAGGSVLLFTLFGRRALLPLSGALAVLLIAVFLYPPLAARTGEAVRLVRAGEWDRLTTYRLGAWAAAAEMTRERPLFGFGPGTYGAEFVPHRLTAEIRARRRYVNPLVTSSYSEAHSDYLQALAETGIPGGVAAIVSAGALAVALLRKAAEPRVNRLEIAVLLGVLAAAAAAASTWFPLQRPITAVPLLLVAGRSWRLAAEAAPGPPPE
ncbi:MAG: O-antigen ligase family protein [Acidobacteriota bacterium]|nr:O-antigen ligase family protein [Acidobacteriota bacterium]MDQ5871730.1 O-antigen ligase family protein [Acidobacteriota bacterium]